MLPQAIAVPPLHVAEAVGREPKALLEFDFDFHRVNNPELAGLSKDETSAMIKAGNKGKNAQESC